ncbi:MAG: EAL domain-containing protein [Zoogloea sp.]|nr:EAL domain-containing protein [Zoogloea sp.]
MPNLAAARILVVDDQPFNVAALTTMLHNSGYENVIGMTDPCAALQLHLDDPFDLILLDWSMPEMDGRDFILRLRQDGSKDFVPVMVLTGKTDDETRLAALGLGVRDFISKPFNADEALMRIRNQLEVAHLYRLKLHRNQQLEYEVRARTEELDYLSRHDPVTGMLNRKGFLAAVAERHVLQAPVAVFVLAYHGQRSLDQLGGYRLGDAAIAIVAERFRDELPEHELACHWREGKFVFLLKGLAWEAFAGRIGAILEDPLQVQGYRLTVKGATGVALFPEHGHSIETLISRASQAAGLAFTEQQDHKLFDPKMEVVVAKRRELEQALAKAGDKQQLRLVYQPKVNLSNGELVGCEALMRWDLDGQSIPPAEFIPLAETTGLIDEMTDWAIQEAIRTCKEWHEVTGRWIPVAVNLSTTTIRSYKQGISNAHEFNTKVERWLTEAQVPGQALEFEVTESALASIFTIDILNALADLDLGLSIDDFGTGYSSLSQLRKLPVNTLKVDRSFVCDLEQSIDARAVAKTVIALGNELNMKVVAEGVETRLQAALLLDMGCHYGQGYLLCMPLTDFPSDDDLPAVQFRKTDA